MTYFVISKANFNNKFVIQGVESTNDFVCVGRCQWLLQVQYTFIVEKVLEATIIKFLPCQVGKIPRIVALGGKKAIVILFTCKVENHMICPYQRA